MAVMRVVVLAVIAAAVAAALAAATPVVVPEQLLAYEAPDGIHIVAVDGSGDRLLRGTQPGDQNPEWAPHGRESRKGNGRSGAPAWSADGRALAFITNEPFTSAPGETSGNPSDEIARMDADGGGYRRLTANRVRDGDPAISPDGRTIAF